MDAAPRADSAIMQVIREGSPMTELTGKVGFASPIIEKKISKRRAGIELLATLALTVCLIVAATAVSIGMARAQAFGAVHDARGAPLALATVIGLALAATGGLTAITAHRRRAWRR
jgi:hypothetical protein